MTTLAYCVWCANPFEWRKRSGRPLLVCSPQCRLFYVRARDRARYWRNPFARREYQMVKYRRKHPIVRTNRRTSVVGNADPLEWKVAHQWRVSVSEAREWIERGHFPP